LSISQEIHNEHPDYEAEEIGFVCPVYCFLPPAIVQDFIARSSFKADYFFAVGTYGAHSTIFPEFLNDFAKKNGVQMNFISTIQMVDTYLPYFDVERELADPKLQRIPERLAAVHASVNKRENYIQPVTEQDRMICDGYYRMSGRDRQRPTVTRSEKIVFATDACIGCGVCTSVCPHGSWKVVDGHSVANGDCENCLACVHNCPQKAISIIPTPPEPQEPNRNARYRNPNVSLADLIKANSQQ
jgi:ferredoxin